ncbi:hypothetical protein [Coralloluteibacterium stylophorae]|uniref:Uncharacterized protein n=1 Tax=Coralloluteibacterium stylophorae TaxID=1776034 RepID=A0A8J8AWL5_9GAMM|nr:hypothetical protein [Coralloluteibacterium stylophorae]MBS7457693.1 hypothetical protein [Coralloluteibacterium stylophorae]
MTLTTGSIPSLIGGVSQQDDTIRHLNQVTRAENAYLHPARGAGKRPAAEAIGVLASNIGANSWHHSIIRDQNERYIVVIGSDAIRVFDHITGHEYVTVVTEGQGDYLKANGRSCDVFRAVTVADTTFILNRERIPAMTSATAPGGTTTAVQTFADLPKGADARDIPNGSIYAITGDPENGFDAFYVRKEADYSYRETIKPGLKNTIDPKTMPHILRRVPDATNPDGFYFSFGWQSWETRNVGDDDTNPPPSFIGAAINDVFYHRERLGFLTTESVVMSETGYHRNFWRTTVTQILDSEVIDVSVPSHSIVDLRHAVPYLSALMLFGTDSQHQLTASPLLSPKTVKVDASTNYSASSVVSPVLLGDSLIYVSDRTEWATVREYFISEEAVTADAADITGHVPEYVPGKVRALTAGPDVEMVFVAPEDASDGQLYVYNTRWAGNDKAQSAWSRWKLSGVGRVLHMHIIDGKLYLVAVSPAGGTELLKIELATIARPTGLPVDVLLDRRCIVQGTYQEFGNFTDLMLPYALSSLSGVEIIKGAGWANPGAYLDTQGAALQSGGQVIRLPGNKTAGKLVVGLKYDCEIELSRQFPRDDRGAAVTIGRLQLRKLAVRFKDAAFFRVRVEPHGRAAVADSAVTEHLHDYSGRTIGDAAFKLDAPTMTSGVFNTPVLSRADTVRITLVNDKPFQAWWQSAEWEGFFSSRNQR